MNKRVRVHVPSVADAGLTAGTLDSFVNFAQRLGLGADNVLSGSTYGFNPLTKNRQLLEWIHRGSWLGGLAVDVVADDMTKKGIEYVTEMPPDATDALDALVQRLNLWHQIGDVVRWSRLYGGAVGVLLIDGQDPATPLRLDTIGTGTFKGVLALDRWQLEPSLTDLVTEFGPHLGQPRYYTVTSNAPALRGSTLHYSRCVFRMVGIALPYQQAQVENLWGISVLERLYDRMVAFDSASMGAAQLVHKAHLRTLSVEGLRELASGNPTAMAGLVAYINVMRRYQGSEGITLLDTKDTFEVQQLGSLTGINDVILSLAEQVSGALQIPLVRLLGQSPAGLNATGDSDLQTYYDHIGHQQVRHLSHGVHVCYQAAARSAGLQLPDNFNVAFRSLWDMTEPEKATTGSTTSKAVCDAFDMGLISERTALLELRQQSRRTGLFTNITDEDVQAASNIVQPPAAEGLLTGLPAPQEMSDEPTGATPRADVKPRGRVRLQPGAAERGAASGQAGEGAGT